MSYQSTHPRPRAARIRFEGFRVTAFVTWLAVFCLSAPALGKVTNNQVLNALKDISLYAVQIEEDSLYQEITVLVREIQALSAMKTPLSVRNQYHFNEKRRRLVQRLNAFSDKFGEEIGTLKSSYETLSTWILSSYPKANVESKLAFLLPRKSVLAELRTGQIRADFQLPLEQVRHFLHEVQPYILVHLHKFSGKLKVDGLYRLMEEEIAKQLQNQKTGEPVSWARLDHYTGKLEKNYPQIRAFELMLSQIYRNQVVSYFSEMRFRGLPKVVWTKGSTLSFFDWRMSIESAFSLSRFSRYTSFAETASQFCTDRLRSLKQTQVAGL